MTHKGGYLALIEAIRAVPVEAAFTAPPPGRPRIGADDPRTERRRAQYRNAKRRARGLPPEPLPAAPRKPYTYADQHRYVSVWLGSRWVPALIDEDGRRIFLGRTA